MGVHPRMPSFTLTFLVLLLLHNPTNSQERRHTRPDIPKLGCNPENDNLELRNELKRMEGNSVAVKWEQNRHEVKAEHLKKTLDKIDGELKFLENKMNRECNNEGPGPIMMGPS